MDCVTDICYDVVYEGDIFEMEKRRGHTIVATHRQKLENVDKAKIIAAYCSIFRGDIEDTTVMTMEEIKVAWRKSKMNPVDEHGNIRPNSTHGQHTKDMAIKTVVNRACKYIINSSDDSSLLAQAVSRTYDDTQTRADIVEEEIQQNAFSTDIDIPDEPVPEPVPEAPAPVRADEDEDF